MEISTTMIAMTTISSMKVKPRNREMGTREWGRVPLPDGRGSESPLRIWSTIGSLLVGFAVDVKHVLAAPACGFRIVLVAAQAPVGGVGEGVTRDAAKQADFLVFGAV